MNNQTIFEAYPRNDASLLIPLLQNIQTEFGYLPEDQLEKVAEHIGIPLSRVYGVATFYNQFRLKPLGKYVIRVCRGTACHVKGSLNILRILESELGIKAGDTTKDLMFSIETVACIGACSIAPVIVINDEYFGGLTPKSIQKLIKKFKDKG
ncbi:TPA: NADH-quinone oxidoreductase subunit NuoE [Candidatus Marinimicrobia bacterium]|nr:NADH-quinone oxidoreductase subunit NuoE [Candidatus Neomarinimicrobiota bacterium]HBY18751.1 NADH-quinone oxidoreductase subunit NuoE [Candidatus Neomarinimicrobiota bacterium]